MRRLRLGGLVLLLAVLGVGVWLLAAPPSQPDAAVTLSTPGEDAGIAGPDAPARSSVASSEPEQRNEDDTFSGVVTFEGTAVPGAEVRLYPRPAALRRESHGEPNQRACGKFLTLALTALAEAQPPLQEATTDSEGRFSMRVEKGKSYAATVTRADLMEALWGIHAGERWKVHLVRAPPVVGELQLPDGGAASGAQLTAFAPETGEVRETRADARGHFSLSGPLSGALLVRVVAAGVAPQVIERPQGTFVLSEPGVRGMVTSKGVGVGGAVVTTPDGQRTTSRSDGTYELAGFPCSIDLVQAQLDDLRAEALLGEDLELEPTSRVTVRLSSSVPALLGGVKLKMTSFEKSVAPVTQTQASAVFEGLLAAEWFIHASGPGLGVVAQKVTLAPGEDRTLSLVLEPAADVSGVVVDDTTGAPVPDLAVLLWGLGDAKVSSPGLRTDASGRFRFAELSPGKFRVRVWGGDYFTVEEDVTPGVEATIRVGRGKRVSGRVIFEGLARPPRDYVVSLLPGDKALKDIDVPAAVFAGQREGTQRSGVSALGGYTMTLMDDGEFTSEPVTPGEYVLVVATRGRAHQLVVQQVAVTTADVRVEVPVPGGLTISGRVSDDQGLGRHTKLKATRAGRTIESATEDDGSFVLRGLEPGVWRLSAHRLADDLYADGSFDAGTQGVVLELYKLRLLEATLVGPSGAFISNVTIDGRMREDTISASFGLRNGELLLWLPPGKGELVVSSGELRSAPLQVPFNGDVNLGTVQLR